MLLRAGTRLEIGTAEDHEELRVHREGKPVKGQADPGTLSDAPSRPVQEASSTSVPSSETLPLGGS